MRDRRCMVVVSRFQLRKSGSFRMVSLTDWLTETIPATWKRGELGIQCSTPAAVFVVLQVQAPLFRLSDYHILNRAQCTLYRPTDLLFWPRILLREGTRNFALFLLPISAMARVSLWALLWVQLRSYSD